MAGSLERLFGVGIFHDEANLEARCGAPRCVVFFRQRKDASLRLNNRAQQ
jgi:hypothetical protein